MYTTSFDPSTTLFHYFSCLTEKLMRQRTFTRNAQGIKLIVVKVEFELGLTCPKVYVHIHYTTPASTLPRFKTPQMQWDFCLIVGRNLHLFLAYSSSIEKLWGLHEVGDVKGNIKLTEENLRPSLYLTGLPWGEMEMKAIKPEFSLWR